MLQKPLLNSENNLDQNINFCSHDNNKWQMNCEHKTGPVQSDLLNRVSGFVFVFCKHFNCCAQEMSDELVFGAFVLQYLVSFRRFSQKA